MTMRLLYNLLQLLLAPLFVIIIPFYLIGRPEKTAVLSGRLGFGLKLPERHDSHLIWIHALSVGEVTSALPLVQQLRAEKANLTTLVFSASTASGHQLAERLIQPHVDALIFYPFDIFFVVKRFLNRVKPDLFILIETDFWPNFLMSLSTRAIPALLFNGRISSRSSRNYRRFGFFFKPLFDQFQVLGMQTVSDSNNMASLGIASEKIVTIGNLKFSSIMSDSSNDPVNASPFPANKLTLLCGSTHDGEEDLILQAYVELLKKYPQLHLVLAPRHIKRCAQVEDLVQRNKLSVDRYSQNSASTCDVTIVDTIGDLSALYAFADISFIGGSLVDEGGHNPLEAARYGSAILFGTHMEDFSEISQDLLTAQAALEVADGSALHRTLNSLAASDQLRQGLGQNARNYTASKTSVIAHHMEVIEQYL